MLSRLVYKWFYFVYKLTYVLGIIGYFIMIAAFFGFSVIFNVAPPVWMDYGLIVMYYGLYFGVLGQDVAEICASVMAAHLGVSIYMIIIFIIICTLCLMIVILRI